MPLGFVGNSVLPFYSLFDLIEFFFLCCHLLYFALLYFVSSFKGVSSVKTPWIFNETRDSVIPTVYQQMSMLILSPDGKPDLHACEDSEICVLLC